MAAQQCVAIFFARALQSCTHVKRCHGGVTAACQICQLGGAGSIPVLGSDKTNDEVVANPLPRSDDLGTHLVVRVGRATCRPCFILPYLPKPTVLVHFAVTSSAQGFGPVYTTKGERGDAEVCRHFLFRPTEISPKRSHLQQIISRGHAL